MTTTYSSMSMSVVALLVIVIVGLSATVVDGQTTEQLIRDKGYPFELHMPTTEDRYTIALHRIPRSGATPVILQHGLLDTSATWVLNDRWNSLGFLLYDAGFDVWLANTRMNTYSWPKPLIESIGKWHWSFDEHALFDIPTVVRYVNITTNRRPHCVAHSQGGTTFLESLAFHDIYQNSSIVQMIALAPVISLVNQRSALFADLAKFHVDTILNVLPAGPFSPTQPFIHNVLGHTCSAVPTLCDWSIASLFGPTENLNQSRMGLYLDHWPDRTSILNMIQWIQCVRSGKMQTRDFLDIPYSKNLRAPLTVFVGDADYLSTPIDARRILGAIPGVQIMEVPTFAHMDFVWSEQAAVSVYPHVIRLLKSRV